VEIKGSGFPVVPGQAKNPDVYLLQPGTTDVSMGFLVPAHPDRDGAFSQWAGLHEHGCEAALLDSQAEQPTGYLAIAAAPQHLTPGPGLQPGERIPNIIAVAHYTYTTTTPPPPPVMLISPSSGPCDGTVEVRGSGFEPGSQIPLDLAGAHSDVAIARLAVATAGSDGEFDVEVTFGPLGCEEAAQDTQLDDPGEPKNLGIFAGYDPARLFVLAQAEYHYTTTSPSVARVLPPAGDGSAVAQPQPTIVLSPASGPCDAVLEVAGRGFPARIGLVLYLLEPGSVDISASALNGAEAGPDGAFSQWVGLRNGGCDAAALDSQTERPPGHLLIAAAAAAPGGAVAAGDRIDGIIAGAQYTYTTTAPHVSTEALSISPASGPCDGAVTVTGSGFQPGMGVLLKLAGPGDVTVATLTSALPDADGRFAADFTLGEAGCRAAQGDVIAGDPAHPQLMIWADRAVAPSTPTPLAAYPTPEPVAISTILASVRYAYTTAQVGGGMPPQALPATGSGPGGRSMSPVWLPLAAALGGLGLTLVVASLYRRRRQG
jgi:hypothetical protein